MRIEFQRVGSYWIGKYRNVTVKVEAKPDVNEAMRKAAVSIEISPEALKLGKEQK